MAGSGYKSGLKSMALPNGLSESSFVPVPSLPEQPLVTIAPSRKWVALNLRDLWTYRDVLYLLMWRDIKVRYKQTVFGVLWALIQPLSAMLVFSFFFGRLAAIPSEGIPYPLFTYSGLLLWTFFSTAVMNSGNSLIGNPNLITKVYFPRMIVPCAALGAALVDLAVTFIPLIALMAYYRIAVAWNLLLAPLLVFAIILLTLGVGLWMAALNVRYRDVRYALPFLIQMWMFITPIIYPASLIPAEWQWLLALNPLAGLMEGCRAALFDREWDWTALAISSSITLVLLISGAYAFRRMEKSFADLV
jgi:homopolymeric O-antigen transport system permease protein